MNKEDDLRFKNDQLIEIWGDIVALKELLASILICTVLGFLGYHWPEPGPTAPLLYGLAGIMLGAFICGWLFKPKRQMLEGSDQEEVA